MDGPNFFRTVDGGNITATQSGTVTLTGFGDIFAFLPTEMNVFVTAATDTLTFSGDISGFGFIVTDGAGRLVLAGNNTHTSGPNGTSLRIDSGTVQLNSSTGAGSGTIVFMGSGGVLALGHSLNFANNILISNSSSSVITFSAGRGNSTLTGNIAAAAASEIITFNTQDFLTVSGVISDGGGRAGIGLIKTGSGTLQLSGANSYSNGTTISGGRLWLLNSTGAGSGNISFVGSGGVLALNNGLTVANNIFLDSSSVTVTTIGSGTSISTLSGIIFGNGAKTFFTFNPGDILTVSGVIAGTGSLTKQGPGTLVLSGNNTYSGGTTIIDGTLTLQSGSALNDTGSVTVNGGTLQLDASETIGMLSGTGGIINLGSNTLTVNQSASGAYSGTITGTGSLTKAGTATLTLSGANTYSGGTTIDGGTLQADNAAALGTSALSLGGGTLAINGVTLANNTTLTASSGIDTISGGTETSTLSGTIGLGANTLSVNTFDAADSLTLSGVIAGTGSLAKTGSGTLILSGANSYSGTTTVSAGTLQADNTAALSTSALSLGGGTLAINGVTLANNTTLTASSGIDTISGGTETSTLSGTVGLGANTLSVNTFDAGDSLTLSGVISGTGNLVKTGSGTLVLSGANVLDGTNGFNSASLFIVGGTVQLNSSTGAGSRIINVAASADLAISNGLTVANVIVFRSSSSSVTTLSGGTEVSTLSGNISSFGVNTMTFNTFDATDSLTVLEVILDGEGPISLVKTGAGTLVLSAANSYSGGTTIGGGTLRLLNSSGAGSGTITVNGSTLELGDGVNNANPIDMNADTTLATLLGGTETAEQSGMINTSADSSPHVLTLNARDAADSLTVSGVISGSGSLATAGPGTIILSATNSYSGTTTVSAGTLQADNAAALSTSALSLGGGTLAINGVTLANNTSLTASSGIDTISGGIETSTLSGTVGLGANTLSVNTFDAGDSLTLSGVISGTGSLSKTGSGTLVLSAANSFSGGTTIGGGTLRLLNSSGAGSGTITVNGSTLELGDGVNNANAIDMNADTTLATVLGGTETAEQSGMINTSADSSPHVLTLNARDAGDSLTISSVISGSGSLATAGSGTIILSAANTYSGTTAVNGGTLLNNGSIVSNVTIAAGATFGGTGTTIGTVTVNGTLAPGPSIGTSAVTGTVTFNSGSTLAVEFDSLGNADLLNVTGPVTVNSGSTVTATPLGSGFTGQISYTLITTTGGITGTFGTLTLADPGFFGVLAPSSNSLVLTLGAIGSTFTAAATTANQSAIAAALDDLDPNANTDFGTIFSDFLALGPAAQAAALDQMSGEGIGTLSSSTLATNTLRIQGIASHLNDARSCRTSQACDFGSASRTAGTRTARAGEDGGQSVDYANGLLWLQGYGGKANMDSGGAFNVAGVDIGYDTWLDDNLLVGLTVGIARDRESGFANLAMAEAEYITFGGHMAVDWDALYFHGIFGLGIADFDTTRTIVFGTTSRTAAGSFDGLNANFYGELGGDGRTGDLTIQPYLALNYTYIERDGFTETGAGSLNLVVSKESLHSLQGIIGFRASTVWEAGNDVIVKHEFRARWVRELAEGDQHRSMVNLVGSTSGAATINDAAGFKNAFVFGGSFDLSKGGSFHIVIGGDYLISDQYHMWSGTGRVVWNF